MKIHLFKKSALLAFVLVCAIQAQAQTVVIQNGSVITSASGENVTVETNIGGKSTVIRTDKNTSDKHNSIIKLNFINSDISGKNYANQNLSGSSFINVEAVGAVFSKADLSSSKMTNVDFSKADFRNANLHKMSLVNVNWEGALLGGAIWINGNRCADDSIGVCR